MIDAELVQHRRLVVVAIPEVVAIIVATVSSIYGLGDPGEYHKMVLHMVRGERIDQRELIRRLTEMQYKRNEMDLARGTYRVRGETIDIHPAESDVEALRIELFDGEIETLTLFDPRTGRPSRGSLPARDPPCAASRQAGGPA